MDNVTSLSEKRKQKSKKRVADLLQIFKPKNAEQKKNELIQKRLDKQRKAEENL